MTSCPALHSEASAGTSAAAQVTSTVVAAEAEVIEAVDTQAVATRRAVADRLGWVRNRAVLMRRLAVVLVVVTIGIEVLVLSPYIARGIGAINHVRWGWLALALWAEFSSMVSFSRLQRVFLRSAGVRVPLRTSLATVFAANAISVTLPGGNFGSLAYSSRRMRRWGASSGLAAFSLAATGILCTIGLAVIALTGGVIDADVDDLALTGGELVLAAALVVATIVVLRRPAQVRGRIDSLHRAVRLREAAMRFLDQLAELRPAQLTWSRGVLLAIGKWVMDLVCLYAACRAVGADPSISTVVLAYAAAMAAATSIPIVPAGLGVVDAALVVALQHGHQSLALATAGVVIYRLISLGLNAGTGWSILLVRSVGGRRTA